MNSLKINGIIEYMEGLKIQEYYVNLRRKNKCGDTIIFMQNDHVFTTGKKGNPCNLLASHDILKKTAIPAYRTDRGGDITYHGPGQILAYPILDISRKRYDLHFYLRTIEYSVMDTVKEFGINAYTVSGMTGVFAEGAKICSIGIGVKHWITFHGFALNVSTNLSFFDMINPCGFKDIKATSMEKITGNKIDIAAVEDQLYTNFKANWEKETQLSKSTAQARLKVFEGEFERELSTESSLSRF